MKTPKKVIKELLTIIKATLDIAIRCPKVLRVYYTYVDKVLTYNVVVSSILSYDELEEFYVSQTEVLSHCNPNDFAQYDGFIVNQITNGVNSSQDYGILVYSKV